MHSLQSQIFNNKNNTKIVVKGRRFGLTSGGALYFIESMLSGRKKRGLWFDTVHGNIDRYIERYFMPILQQIPSSLWKWRQVKKELEFQTAEGKAYIDFRSADNPEVAEGHGYDLIFLNESGIILRNDSLWYNTILPMTIDYGDCEVIIGGTPKGRNLFFKLAKKAQEDLNWEYFHFTSYQNPYLDKKVIDELAENMPEHVRRQEIFAEFLDGSGTVFRNIRNCIRGTLEEPHPGKSYKGGIDPARLQDYTVITILDNDNHLVAYERFTDIEWSVTNNRIEKLLKKYNAPAYIDSTGIGDVILDDLQKRGLRVEGYKFTSQSKRVLIDTLILAIEKAEVTFPEIKELIDELELFEYDVTSTNIKYSAPAGFHDDFVTSLGLALMLASRKPFKYIEHYAVGSPGWRRQHRGQSSDGKKTLFEMEREFKKTGEYSEKW